MAPFKQVDVFTAKKFRGNPVAVFFDGDGLSTEDMQLMAQWTNLLETTFVLKPTEKDADYQVRIFTPQDELPFAGHPTIGTCHAVIEAGIVKPRGGKVVQQCGAGLVNLTVDDNGAIEFQLPYYRFTPISPAVVAEVEKLLSLPGLVVGEAVVVDDGPKWACFEVITGDAVSEAKPNMGAISELSKQHGWTGIEVFGRYTSNCKKGTEGSYELRNLAPATGVPEDPVCGLGSGALGAFVAVHAGRAEHNIDIRQGRNIGRDGHIRVRVDHEDVDKPAVFVKGNAVTVLDGSY